MVLMVVRLASFFSLCFGASIPVDFGGNSYVRFNAQFIDSSNRVRFAPVELGMDRRIICEPRSVTLTRLIIAPRMSLGNGRSVVDLGQYCGLMQDRVPDVTFSFQPNALIMRPSVAPAGGYLVVPTSPLSGTLIVDPDSLTGYCFDGELFYANHRRSSIDWHLQMAVRIVDNGMDMTQIEPASINLISCFIREGTNPEYSHLPSVIRVPSLLSQSLIVPLEAAGVMLLPVGRAHGKLLINFNESLFETLPKIQFIMRTDDDRLVNLVVLEPRDYIVALSETSFFFRLVLDGCSIDKSIMRKLVVHFDPHNHRIGFGEPLAAL